ncbi:MAG TPA: permease [Chloroflexota bacterium]|nr:permease [Chloroflexota bacterium]
MIAGLLTLIVNSLREAFFMFWETLWALVLGFTLSGAVQAFVSRAEMQRALGGRGPKELARASLFGMVSSSCSYAATAMAKSLFQKGADFSATLTFMFASTNLVVELGIVLWVLIGWQFTTAEFVGGFIMIGLLALVNRVFIPRALSDKARQRLQASEPGGEHEHETGLQGTPWRERLRSAAGWADAASYTLTDVTMLRRELLIGYMVAGFLAVLVPGGVWQAVFLSGHGFWTSLENAVVGPLIAIISFVCSIGNVPLAAALWKGGISFGGVASFIFADLITMPLLLIYRRYYGAALTLRMLALFWIVMSAAGLVTEYLFLAAGLVPQRRPAEIAPAEFAWNYTTILNIVFLGVFGLVAWLARNQQRFGGGLGYAIDPMCGMQVQTANAPATAELDGQRYYFCSDHCMHHFLGSRTADSSVAH